MRWVALAAVVLLSGCITLDKGAEADMPTVTCILNFGGSCQFLSDKKLDKKQAEGSIGKDVEVLPFPPIGRHEVE